MIISSSMSSAPFARAQLLQPGQESRRAAPRCAPARAPRRRSARVLREQRLEARRDRCSGTCARQLAHRARECRAGIAGRADEPVVGGEERVVGADRDHVAAGVGARELNRAVDRVEPSLQNLTISASARARRNVSAHSTSIGAGRAKLVPCCSCARAASTTGAIGVAERDRAQAHAVLDELVAVGVPDVAAGAARDERRRADRDTGRRPWRRCARRPE